MTPGSLRPGFLRPGSRKPGFPRPGSLKPGSLKPGSLKTLRRASFIAILVALAVVPGPTSAARPCTNRACQSAGLVRWARLLPGAWEAQAGLAGTTPAQGAAYAAMGRHIAVIGIGTTVFAYQSRSGAPAWDSSLAGFRAGSRIVSVRTWPAVVTVGVLQAGTKENVIPDEAIIKLNVRTFDEGVRKRVLAAITRIVNAEAAASGAPRPPEITPLDHYPLNVNDAEASKRVVDAFRRHFPAERVRQTGPAPASEDFGSFGTEWHVPSVFWFVGGTDPDVYAKAKKAGRLNELPVNHSPLFAPVIHPTLQTGVETLVVGAQAWLSGQRTLD